MQLAIVSRHSTYTQTQTSTDQQSDTNTLRIYIQHTYYTSLAWPGPMLMRDLSTPFTQH